LLSRLVADSVATRLWRRDPSLFADVDNAREVPERLGWLDAAVHTADLTDEVAGFVQGCDRDGLQDVYLLGMGGSSLCAEVLRDVAPRPDGRRLTVLDTTDERAIGAVTAALRAETALFLVASKSGSTIEVSTLERHFWGVMDRARAGGAGQHFAAITDPGTALQAHARERSYRHTFLNPPDIGGRYSALSKFGMVPAALLGADLGALSASAAAMARACQQDAGDNPGLALGAFMAFHAREGRDLLTITASPRLHPLGPWIEQLVAESTGKHGRGVLPVVGEPAGEPPAYRHNRAFVMVHDGDDAALTSWTRALETAGHPVFVIHTSPDALAGEFLRWEVATAVAGAVLGVNPFDQPDVQAAKTITKSQLDAFLTSGALRLDPPLRPADGAQLRTHAGDEGRDPGYLAILDYLPVDTERDGEIGEWRAALRNRTGLAVTHGHGPRYLHSTGQYHKGGPDTGLFVIVTSDDATITLVPDTGYSFSVLKHAQALGDFEALRDAGRRVLHVHLDANVEQVMPVLRRLVDDWLP
jgi:glucose-6-phosphate isomerase